ncbi:MAG: hypothetical protein E7Z87_00495 [Cyanobacteria bacterium SIG26]|nr:hypothetical protein [Cyanobacteria bacterium SIG26]
MKRFILTLIFGIVLGLNHNAFAVEEIYSLDEIEPPKTIQTNNDAELKTSSPFEAVIVFDWLDITQSQREDLIKEYQQKLFETNSSKIYFEKDEFKKEFAKFYKDKQFKLHYMLTNEGVTEDEDARYCAFYHKNNTLMIYAIQYKNNPRQAFYYSPFGKMYYTDLMSDEYPNFPYTSMQYNRKGKLSSAIYFVSKDLQYMFGPDKQFQGVWYKDKMYDKNGKQTLTRTHW